MIDINTTNNKANAPMIKAMKVDVFVVYNTTDDGADQLPTNSPTLVTKRPTELPKLVPTTRPTKLPTKIPTRFPSKLPTKAPSKLRM